MHGICSECGQITNMEEYPYFYSLCSQCWRRFKRVRVSRRVGGAHPAVSPEAGGNHRCLGKGRGGRGVGVGRSARF